MEVSRMKDVKREDEEAKQAVEMMQHRLAATPEDWVNKRLEEVRN